MTTLQNKMKPGALTGLLEGKCAHCEKPVYESLFTLDDAYAVWVGVCPHCEARNLLGGKGRGYSSKGMTLVLPTPEEIAWNKWPQEWPTEPMKSEASGLPTTTSRGST